MIGLSFYLGTFANSSDLEGEVKTLKDQMAQTTEILNELLDINNSISTLDDQPVLHVQNENSYIGSEPINTKQESKQIQELTKRVAFLESNSPFKLDQYAADPYTLAGSPTPESLH
jgi:hypothetical protein